MSCIIFGKYEPQREIIISDKENGNSMQHTYKFPNGYGVVVIQNCHSKGHEDGLYELAVLKEGDLCYSTTITSDVIGYLTADEVAEHLSRIERLPDLREKRKEGSKLCNTQMPYTK
nr:MAG TPA: hypothetical protein [Caudoviricetes sp.]